jgi:ubiquinone/menaquinone biosynthesis C-methylase UbiE
MSDQDIPNQVRQFYNQIGWTMQSDGFYQNARYEDLRPVSAEYIHRCHLRVNRHIPAKGKYLLDAGCGPIQYPEYLTYSQNFQYRLCVDISIVALKEARKRIGKHGLFVVADVSQLPFSNNCVDGAVTLHTFHHLPLEAQVKAYHEIHRMIKSGATAVVVNGWTDPFLMRISMWMVKLVEKWGRRVAQERGNSTEGVNTSSSEKKTAKGTFIAKLTPRWLKEQIGKEIPYHIYCWRSVNVRFLRAFIHEKTAGKFLLKVLYWKEEILPGFFGKVGQYPLIVITKERKS